MAIPPGGGVVRGRRAQQPAFTLVARVAALHAVVEDGAVDEITQSDLRGGRPKVARVRELGDGEDLNRLAASRFADKVLFTPSVSEYPFLHGKLG